MKKYGNVQFNFAIFAFVEKSNLTSLHSFFKSKLLFAAGSSDDHGGF